MRPHSCPNPAGLLRLSRGLVKTNFERGRTSWRRHFFGRRPAAHGVVYFRVHRFLPDMAGAPSCSSNLGPAVDCPCVRVDNEVGVGVRRENPPAGKMTPTREYSGGFISSDARPPGIPATFQTVDLSLGRARRFAAVASSPKWVFATRSPRLSFRGQIEVSLHVPLGSGNEREQQCAC